MTAQRKTNTQANGGSGNGILLTNGINEEIGALWRYVSEPLTVDEYGAPNAIVAFTDSSVVSSILTIQRGKRFVFVAIDDSTDPTVTIEIDGIEKTIVDVDGDPLAEGAIVADRLHVIEFDGTDFRLISGGGSAGAGAASDHGANGGRLSISTGVPVHTAAVTGQTTLYWTPFIHNRIGLYDGAAWSVVASLEKSIKSSDTQTGSTTNGQKPITGLTDTSQLVVGMKISGTGVGVGSVIQSIDSATQVTSSVNSTATGSASITFKLPANTGYDVYGKLVASALKLFLVARAALFTVTTNALQDGVTVKSDDDTMRWLGWFKTSNTDGEIDYRATGQYRFAIWNQDNRLYRQHSEAFDTTGTWHKSPCTTRVKSDVAGGSGSPGVTTAGVNSLSQGGQGGNGGRSIKNIFAGALGTTETVTVGGVAGTSSFGSHHSATGGATGSNGPNNTTPGANGADGAGSGGDFNFTGHGPAGQPTNPLAHNGASGQWGQNSSPATGRTGWVIVDEVLEI
jgi:hypothetical protein